MRYKRYVILALCFVFIISGAIYWITQKNPENRSSWETQSLSPDQAIKEAIDRTIASAFLPTDYHVIKDSSNIVRLGFGDRYADNYKLDWSKNNAYFLAFVGYDKEDNRKGFGYILNIYVPGVKPSGLDIAKSYLQKLPDQGWRNSAPEINGEFVSQISSALWQEQENKIYLEILSLRYNQLQSGFIPEKPVQDITIIRFLFFTPNNPQYNNLEEFQASAHSIYGQK
jgi:hypothetical protein